MLLVLKWEGEEEKESFPACSRAQLRACPSFGTWLGEGKGGGKKNQPDVRPLGLRRLIEPVAGPERKREEGGSSANGFAPRAQDWPRRGKGGKGGEEIAFR